MQLPINPDPKKASFVKFLTTPANIWPRKSAMCALSELPQMIDINFISAVPSLSIGSCCICFLYWIFTNFLLTKLCPMPISIRYSIKCMTNFVSPTVVHSVPQFWKERHFLRWYLELPSFVSSPGASSAIKIHACALRSVTVFPASDRLLSMAMVRFFIFLAVSWGSSFDGFSTALFGPRRFSS